MATEGAGRIGFGAALAILSKNENGFAGAFGGDGGSANFPPDLHILCCDINTEGK